MRTQEGIAKKIVMYSMDWCPYCRRAEQLLRSKGVEFEKITVDRAPEMYKEMVKLSNRRTVPQIFIGDRHVGGYDDLAELEGVGELDELLNGLADKT